MAEKHIKKYPNGAKLIYYRSNVNDETKICFGFLGGSSKDWKNGTAHAVEHASFLGIPGMTREQIDRTLRLNAVRHNAATTQDYIYFVFNVPNSNLDEVSRIYSAIGAKKDFDEESWTEEKEVIRQEKWVHYDELKDTQVGILDYLMNKSTYGVDRLIGSEDSLDKITAKDLTRFKENNFISENLIVSVVSNLPYDQIKKLVERDYIYRFPSKPKNKVELKKRTYNFGNQIIALNDPTAKSFEIMFVLKGKQNYEKNELYTHFENWYFNGLAGRLDKDLRHQYPLTYSPSTYNFEPKDLRLKVFDITTTPENANACVYLMANILGDLIKNGISEEEFNEFQKSVMANRERRTELKNRVSMELFDAVASNTKPFVTNFYSKLLKLTREDINEYLRKTYTNSKLTLGYKGNLDLAECSELLYHPYNVLTEERVQELHDPLLSFEEVVLMYNPKYQFKQWVLENYPKKKPLKPKFTKEASKQKRQLIKNYLEEVKAAEQKENEQIASEPEKPAEHPVVKADDELVM